MKKVTIIGAGVAGLSAGCYARMNGYETEIFESHHLPGGLCTSWKRGAYTIDGCIHWLVDSKPGGGYYPVWQELGVVRNRDFFYYDEFVSLKDLSGRELHLYSETDRLKKHLYALAPEDTGAINRICRIISKLARFKYPVGDAPELIKTKDGIAMLIKLLPFIPLLSGIGKQKMSDIAGKFRNPFLRKAFAQVLFDETLPALGFLFTMGGMSRKTDGYPLGGSLEFAKSMAARFAGLGGKIHYRSEVKKILEDEGRATGIRLENGNEIKSDYVISAADMRKTLFSFLDGSRIDPVHRELFENVKLFPPIIQVCFGVDMDFSDTISCAGTLYELDKPLEIAGKKLYYFHLKNFCYDPSLAPKGKSLVGSWIFCDHDYWEKFRNDDTAYSAEKEKIIHIVREQIEKLYPGFSAKTEMTDIATPLTFEKFTSNWKGTYMTWMVDNQFRRRHPFIPMTVPGLDNFYMAGMWTNPPGGIPGSAVAGRRVVQVLCNRDNKAFISFSPGAISP